MKKRKIFFDIKWLVAF